ncbi:MAG: hypothetical protein AAGI25_10705 [Bacteroidota bacterium]
MKIFKSKYIIKSTKKWTWITLFFLGVISVGSVSCSDDDNSGITLVDGEAESAWVYGFNNQTPNGSVNYMIADEEIPENADISQAVELGLSASIYSFGEHPYTWNGDAATITKWSVDRVNLTLAVEGIISLASKSISGSVGAPVFLSETQAFFSKLSEGIIVEWNPSTMEITKTHNVAPLANSETVEGWYSEIVGYSVPDGKIFYPIGQSNPYSCCEYYDNIHATVAVFDPSASTIDYIHDNRLFAGRHDFMVDENGETYVTPARDNSFILPYFDIDPSSDAKPWAVLKFNEDGTFDPNFYFDLSTVVPMTFLNSASMVRDNKIVINYVDNTYTHPESYDDKFDVYDSPDFKTASVDLITGEVEMFEALSQSSGTYLLNTIDGINYYQIFDKDHETRNFLYRQNSLTDYTTVSTNETGRIIHIGKLW